MPELLEVERSRAFIEAHALERLVEALEAPDPWYLKEGLTAEALADLVVGSRFVRATRHGKLLLVEVEHGPVIGLHFGMTGRLLIDGRPGVGELVYSSNRAEPAWDRLVVHFADGGDLRIRDPRRLGSVVVEPDVDRLGVDADVLSPEHLAHLVEHSRTTIKSLLLDQQRIAGLGNLLVDDALFRAGIDPVRRARDLSASETRKLARAIAATLRVLGRRGGSHTGDLQAERREGGRCPRDGALLERRTIAGRTTWSCPLHQQ